MTKLELMPATGVLLSTELLMSSKIEPSSAQNELCLTNNVLISDKSDLVSTKL